MPARPQGLSFSNMVTAEEKTLGTNWHCSITWRFNSLKKSDFFSFIKIKNDKFNLLKQRLGLLYYFHYLSIILKRMNHAPKNRNNLI